LCRQQIVLGEGVSEFFDPEGHVVGMTIIVRARTSGTAWLTIGWPVSLEEALTLSQWWRTQLPHSTIEIVLRLPGDRAVWDTRPGGRV